MCCDVPGFVVGDNELRANKNTLLMPCVDPPAPEQSPPGQPQTHTDCTWPGMSHTLVDGRQLAELYTENLKLSYQDTSPCSLKQHWAPAPCSAAPTGPGDVPCSFFGTP